LYGAQSSCIIPDVESKIDIFWSLLLDILRLKSLLRNWFYQEGIDEIPESPRAINMGWHHPDLLMSLVSNQKASIYAFQMMHKASVLSTETATIVPGLVWIIKPYELAISKTVGNFLDELGSRLNKEGDAGSFSMAAVDYIPNPMGEKGCAWNILLNGGLCGTLTVLSEILKKDLSSPTAIVTLNLQDVVDFCNIEGFKAGVPWLTGKSVNEFLTLQQYSALIDKSDTKDNLKKSFEKIKKSTELALVARFFAYISLISDHQELIIEDFELQAELIDEISKCLTEIPKELVSEGDKKLKEACYEDQIVED
jgi:hypothetical protein